MATSAEKQYDCFAVTSQDVRHQGGTEGGGSVSEEGTGEAAPVEEEMQALAYDCLAWTLQELEREWEGRDSSTPSVCGWAEPASGRSTPCAEALGWNFVETVLDRGLAAFA